jgi:polysaccharide biosynthesis protein PslH
MATSATPAHQRRVLVLANRLPFPVDDGWKTRTYHIIRGLARDAAVTLLVFHDGPEEEVAGLQRSMGPGFDIVTVPSPRSHSPLRLLLGLVTRTPVYVWNMQSSEYAQEVRRLVDTLRPDVAVAELTYMFPYLRGLPAGVRRIIDTHNVDSVVLQRYAATLPGRLRRWYAALTARKLQRFERQVFSEADVVWVCSQEEAELASRIAPDACVKSIPNGVDTATLAPVPDETPRPGRLLFFGRMDYAPNRDAVHYFADSILPVLRQAQPAVELHIVGNGIDDDLRALASRVPGIKLVGRVDDLRPALAAASAVIVPLRMGGGTRLKILEAMSIGRPVISTTIGAEGLDVVSGRELLIADSPEDFAAAVDRVLRDPTLTAELGANARATAERLYDWRRIHEAAAVTLVPAHAA